MNEAQVIQVIAHMVNVILDVAKEERTKGELQPQCVIIVQAPNGQYVPAFLATAYEFFGSMHGMKYEFPAFIRESCYKLKKEEGCTLVAIMTLSDAWWGHYINPVKGDIIKEDVMPCDSPHKQEAITIRVDTKDNIMVLLVFYEIIKGKIIYDEPRYAEKEEAACLFVNLPENLFPKDI